MQFFLELCNQKTARGFQKKTCHASVFQQNQMHMCSQMSRRSRRRVNIFSIILLALSLFVAPKLVFAGKPVCGNNVLEGSEQCNPPDLTTCSDNCKIVPTQSPSTQNPGVNSFSGTYQTASMNKALAFCSHAPSAAGPYPILIYVTGTRMFPCLADDEVITQATALRGFVACL